MAAAGNATSHQRMKIGLSEAAPSASSDPQLAAGACTPKPKETQERFVDDHGRNRQRQIDQDDSRRFGSRCLRMIRR